MDSSGISADCTADGRFSEYRVRPFLAPPAILPARALLGPDYESFIVGAVSRTRISA